MGAQVPARLSMLPLFRYTILKDAFKTRNLGKFFCVPGYEKEALVIGREKECASPCGLLHLATNQYFLGR